MIYTFILLYSDLNVYTQKFSLTHPIFKLLLKMLRYL